MIFLQGLPLRSRSQGKVCLDEQELLPTRREDIWIKERQISEDATKFYHTLNMNLKYM